MHRLKFIKKLPLNLTEIQNIQSYCSELLTWSKVHNLVSKTDPEKEILKNLEQSIVFSFFLQESKNKKVVDLGTGAGFPGLICAILDQNKIFYLYEKRSKRISFLKFVVAKLGLKNIVVSRETFSPIKEKDIMGQYVLISKAVLNEKDLMIFFDKLKYCKEGLFLANYFDAKFQKKKWCKSRFTKNITIYRLCK